MGFPLTCWWVCCIVALSLTNVTAVLEVAGEVAASLPLKGRTERCRFALGIVKLYRTANAFWALCWFLLGAVQVPHLRPCAACAPHCRLRAPAGVLLPVRPVFERCGPESQQWRGLWRGTCRETYDKICRFKRQNLSLCETGISSAGAGFKHVRQSRPSMISTGGVGGESNRPGVGSAHALSAFAVRLSCAGRLASPSRPSSSPAVPAPSGRPAHVVAVLVRACSGAWASGWCASGSAAHVVAASPSRADAFAFACQGRGLRIGASTSGIPAAVLTAACAPHCRLCASLPPVRLAAGLLLLDGGLCLWARVVRDRSAGRSGRARCAGAGGVGRALVAAAVPRVPGGCRRPGKDGPALACRSGCAPRIPRLRSGPPRCACGSRPCCLAGAGGLPGNNCSAPPRCRPA